MNVGDLVKVIDQFVGGGFAPAGIDTGLVIQVDDRICPEQIDVLLSNGTILFAYADDLEDISDG